jgi:hypothetical protein
VGMLHTFVLNSSQSVISESDVWICSSDLIWNSDILCQFLFFFSFHITSFFISSWHPPRELKHLSADGITTYLESQGKKISGDLYKAYLVAENPESWIAEKEANRIEAEKYQLEDENEDVEEDELDEDETGGGKRKREEKVKKDKKSKKAKLNELAKKKVGSCRGGFEKRPVRTVGNVFG